MSRLRHGQPFPTLEIPAAGGGTLSLPGDLAGSHGVVLIYRGSWCPYCNAPLAAFSRAAGALTELGVTVAAHKLRFPVGHSADAGKVAAATGAYVNDEPRYLQSTGFVLDPEGKVIVSVYSSGAIGRLLPEDVAGLVNYLKSQRRGPATRPGRAGPDSQDRLAAVRNCERSGPRTTIRASLTPGNEGSSAISQPGRSPGELVGPGFSARVVLTGSDQVVDAWS